ncbi:hypothetical protein [Methanobacterium sp. MBAC-LM]|uniref:hypothetical protein n=1 Tax=Methanobacterium sp. MBAC-LM TaxID=3412034 RepID=UPI003C78F214
MLGQIELQRKALNGDRKALKELKKLQKSRTRRLKIQYRTNVEIKKAKEENREPDYSKIFLD